MAGARRGEWAVWVGFLAFFVVVGAGARALRLRSMDRYLATQSYEDIYYLPPPAWLPVLSLGYREAAADLLWMRALVYFGTEVEHHGEVRYVYQYADAILALDPMFERAYRWAGMAGIYRPQAVGIDAYRRAVDYLRRGVERFPDDGQLAWDLGATLMFELRPLLEGDEHRADREEIEAEAVEYMETAARMGAGPPYLGLVNASTLTQLGRLDAARRHLEEIYATVRDPDIRRQIELRIDQLASESHGRAFRAAMQELESRHAHDFDYVPLDFYVQLGRRPPIDEGALLGRRFLPPAVTLEADEPAGPPP